MISRNLNFCETFMNDNDTIILETVCPSCGKKQKMTLTGERAKAYQHGKIQYEFGALLQNALSAFTPNEREFILTGICDECWKNMCKIA